MASGGDLPSNTSEEVSGSGKDYRSKSFSSAEEYLSGVHSLETKRRNAVLYLRAVSDEVNRQKFPDIIKKHREKCDPTRQRKFYAWHWRVAIDSVIFMERLRLGARNHRQRENESKGNDNSGT